MRTVIAFFAAAALSGAAVANDGQVASFRDCPVCPEMIVAPGGSFVMGSPARETGRRADEGPVRSVEISSFAISRAEITVAEFDRFVAASGFAPDGGCRTTEDGEALLRADRSWRSPGFDQTVDHPVVCASRSDALAFIEWLNGEAEGGGYRLPTEAEWEYVARAGSATAFNTGAALKDDDANFRALRPDDPTAERIEHVTTPVGSFPANAFGLVDTHGNAAEWVADCWHWSYAGAPSDGSAWMAEGGGQCERGILRGGGASSLAQNVRAARRVHRPEGYRGSFAGFRVAKDIAP